MDIFLELLLPTIFVSLALLGVLFGYSLWVLLGGFSSVKKTVKDWAAATSTKDSGIPQWLRSNMAHWRGSDPGILVLIWIAYPIMLMLINNLTISTRVMTSNACFSPWTVPLHEGLQECIEMCCSRNMWGWKLSVYAFVHFGATAGLAAVLCLRTGRARSARSMQGH